MKYKPCIELVNKLLASDTPSWDFCKKKLYNNLSSWRNVNNIDLELTIIESIFQAAKIYKPKCKFINWATFITRNNLCKAFSKANAGYIPILEDIDICPEIHDGYSSFDTILIAREDIANVLVKLSPIEFQVLGLIVSGKLKHEILGELNIDRFKHIRIMKNIRRKLVI